MPFVGFIVVLGIVLVVFYLFIKKIFTEDKIIDEKNKGSILPIDIDEKMKKGETEDKSEFEDIKKDAKEQELSTEKDKNENNTEHI